MVAHSGFDAGASPASSRRPDAGIGAVFVSVLALSVMLWMAPAGAGQYQWSSGGPAATGPVLSLAVDPSNPMTVYAGSGTSGGLQGTVFKSTDNGLHWTIMNTNLPSVVVRGLAINPQSPGTIYAAGGTVFKSTDGAGSWTPKNAPPAPGSAVCVTLDPQNPSIVFAGTSAAPPNNLFRSANGGDTWTAVGNGLPNGIVNAVIVDPQNSAIVYAGTQFGLFKSTNGGQNDWAPMNNGFAPSMTPTINALALDPNNPAVLYAGTGGFGVFKSTDGGANWTPATAGITTGAINGLVMDPQRSNVLYASTSSAGVFRTTDGGQGWSALNIGLTPLALTSVGISQTGTCVHAGTNNGPSSHVFDYSLVADCGPLPPPAPPPVAAVLPSSRSVHVNTPATIFATIINPGTSIATGVGIGLGSSIAASLTFQTTDPATNLPTGTQNVPADIPPGGFQTYLIAITPTASLAPTEVQFVFAGENTQGPAAALVGVNTLLLSASFSAIPDVVALAATLTGDGIVNIPGSNGTGVFAVATVNVGASGLITASADTGGVPLPLDLFICQTDPANGQCLTGPTPSVTLQINGGDTPTFTILAVGRGDVPFDPATNRISVRFKDAGNVTRGSTSVAPRTQ